MLGFQRQRIWQENELTDAIKANLLSTPDTRIIASTTSNLQVEPCCIVLYDHKYPIIGVTSVTVKRSRNNDSNTASISLLNIGVRYSGPNKEKLAANTPISIYMGYSKRYLQRFEGYIDTLSMTVNETSSTIQIECRDKAKDWIESKDISAGIYSENSEYFGEGEWHYKLGSNGEHLPRAWTHEEVLRDVCYILGLRDIAPYVYVVADTNDDGFTTYSRHINYEADWDFEIDPKWESDIVCNFVEENALDVLGKLCQSIFHEVFFDHQGKLVVRPAKTATDDAVYYYKEERDIASLTQNIDDDNVANIITIIGQTADETAVIYPFAAVAVGDTVTLEKGADEYGYQLSYPKIVANENVGTLEHPSLYAHTISPGSAPVTDYRDNPENKPSYDFLIHYPNFSQPYEKQVCMEATCPIITDEAIMANATNLRTWNYYGELDTAVAYEKQPIMLKDRFDKDILVVCKERSMDDDSIRACGNTPYEPGVTTDDTDPDAVPVNIPTVFDHYRYAVSSDRYSYAHDEDQPQGTSVYNGLATSGVTGSYYLMGYQEFKDDTNANELPASAAGQIPSGLSASDFDGKGVTITQFSVVKGTSPYPAVVSDSVYDMATLSTITDYAAILIAEQTVDVHNYQVGSTMLQAVPNYIDSDNFSSIQVVNFTTNPASLYQNCQMVQSPTRGGTIELNSPYVIYSDLPSGAVDRGFSHQVTIRYPLVFNNYGYGLSGSTVMWHVRVIDDDFLEILNTIRSSNGKVLEVWITTVDRRYMTVSDPDCNCIYWKWFGAFKREDTESSFRPGPKVQDMTAAGQGQDAEGNPRKLISKEQFYKLAADPHTVVIECMTAGVDHQSWAEVVEFDENKIVMKGHNLYGSMADEYAAMLEAVEKQLHIIGAALVALGLGLVAEASSQRAVVTSGGGGSTTSPGGGLAAGFAAAGFTIVAGVILMFKDFDKNVGQNVSKVMEDMSGRVTAVRRPEIEIYEAGAGQACQWYARVADDTAENKNPNGKLAANPAMMRYSAHSMFGYDENCSLDATYRSDYLSDQSATGISRNHCWVYVLDLTQPGPLGPTYPEGAMLTAFGWETPEVGDRNPIQYYTGVDYHDDVDSPSYTYPTNPSRTVITTRYAIEAFADDPYDTRYTAETLLAMRFENTSWGIHPKANETWYNSAGYELLVDRSMEEQAVTDAGIWYDFWEKRDDYKDRRYKYVALVVYSWNVQTLGANTTASATSTNVTGSPSMAIFCDKRWGLFVPRGLYQGWYSKFRWLERNNTVTRNKTEQNYITTDVIFQGQQLLIANLFNNFKYSTVEAQIRVWGKAFGTYAPTIVYYKEADTLSIGTYGQRELNLTNNCINDFKTARRLANMLTGQSNETFSMTTTGKPYIYEGDVVHVKEENTGAIAGVFRDWENVWKTPETRTCVQPGNQLGFTSLQGLYSPQCATPTYENNTLVACSDGTNPTYLVEIDKACNPVWYITSTTNTRPTFILRWLGVGGLLGTNKWQYTIVGLADGTIHMFDHVLAQQINQLTLPTVPLCAAMDEEQSMMFVGTATQVYAIDMASFSIKFVDSSGGAAGIAVANWSVYDDILEDSSYREYGVLFTVGNNGIACRRIYSDRNRNSIGSMMRDENNNPTFLAAGNSFGVPFTRPGSLEFDKHTGELVYVNRATTTQAASIWGLHVEVDLDTSHPEYGMTAEFDELRWKIDYMEDVDLKNQIPNADARRSYINNFFQPIHAVYDVNKSLLVCDSINNRVYKLNPSGKFYVSEVTDQFDISDDYASYKQTYDLVSITAAGSLQLTNFGRNFLTTKTEDQITAQTTTTMGRIVAILPRDKYQVKLLSSETVVEAINNSGVNLRLRDTVIVMMGFAGDTSGVGTIIAKKALNDWTVETGSPYTYVDATTTSLDVSKYGIGISDNSNGAGGTSADLSVYNSRIRILENRVKTLASLHGLSWN